MGRIHLRIINSCNLFIDIDIYRTEESLHKSKPLVIFCHGFKGFKNWGGFPYMLGKLSEKGFISAGFNFSHNGVSSEKPFEFHRLDLFAQNTISKELDDLRCVIDYFYDNHTRYKIDRSKIALIGHSRGGGTSLIMTWEDKRIKALITLASVATFDRYTERQKANWKKMGYTEVPNLRTGQIMKMNVDYLIDIEINHERFDICRAASQLKIPLLIIHGREDLSVKVSDAERIYSCTDKKFSRLEIIENTGHTFGIEHPFKGTGKAFEKVIELMSDFLKENL